MEDTQKVGNVEMMISPIDHKNRPPRSRKRLSARGPVAEIGEALWSATRLGELKTWKNSIGDGQVNLSDDWWFNYLVIWPMISFFSGHTSQVL